MDAMAHRKNALAIKIMIMPDESKDQKIQKDLQEEDVAPFLPEVDEEKGENAMGSNDPNEMQEAAENPMEEHLLGMHGKPGSLREKVKAMVMKKKGLSK
jgi:hypothetical protein